jgi:hypothetical protein
MRIYLSSTYVDLVEHRAAVARVLRQMGHEVIGMEEYVAEGARPIDRCLADVTACDLYVGVFAWQYGYVPMGSTSGGTFAHPDMAPQSITEAELRCAVPKSPMVFLLDPMASWPANWIDAITGENEGGVSIKRLRDEVSQEWLAGFFKTPENLARQVSAAVRRRQMSDRVGTMELTIQTGFEEALMAGGSISDSTLYSMKMSLSAHRAKQLCGWISETGSIGG